MTEENDLVAPPAPLPPLAEAPAPDATAPRPRSSLRLKPKHIIPVVTTLLVVSFIVATSLARFSVTFDPWVVDGDTKQTVWQFYRYNQPGVLPLGHLLTDYAWVYNAPPLYRVVMIPLSTVMDPLFAGNVVHVVCYFGAILACYWVGRSQVNHYAGLAAVMLYVRTPVWHHSTAGGHARTFGPILVLLFAGAWLTNRRRLCLALLIVQAGIYPPPAMACSLAYGVWSLWMFAKDRQWRPLVELAVTAVLILVMAKSQDLLAADWWGSPVWYKDVLHHPAFQHGSRMEFVPHDAVATTCWRYVAAVFDSTTGHDWPTGLSAWNQQHHLALILAPAALILLAALLPKVKFPKRTLLLMVTAFIAYILARELAFKLHVPSRVLRETWVPMIPVIITLATFLLFRRLLPGRRAIANVVATILALAPTFIAARDGLGPDTGAPYSNNARDAPLFEWIRANTRKDGEWAGSYRAMDLVGMFGWRVAYVNWTLAHPFRPGYWKEIERRTLRMYDAYYAVDIDTVIKFADQEHIQYFMVDRRNAKSFYETKSRVRPFPPTAGPVQAMFDNCQRKRCILFDDAVKPAVVKVHGDWKILDVDKLRALARKVPAWRPPVYGPAPAPLYGPAPEPKPRQRPKQALRPAERAAPDEP